MADFEEDQEAELEALKSIYTEEEFVELSSRPWLFTVRVSTEADVAGSKFSAVVEFSLPQDYPNVIPVMKLVSWSDSLTNEQQKEVEDVLNQQAEANTGMPMVYTLVSAVQDKLQEYSDAVKGEQDRQQREKEEEERRKEEAKLHGTIVTMESFEEWREKFRKEMEAMKGVVIKDIQSTQLTGKQMFERDASLALSDTKFLISTDEVQDTPAVEVDESLFQELGDLEDEGEDS